ncbi:alpha/beta hydrolase [Raoultibacter phocaeensis]|uniref:alpha/beta hydrolase n=1 Tax=Raoultibacter phocaeensis TaxID=2479841 RepID=UPI001119C708|nr:alpha/beta hydrolase [Raoultibacter phocaeensis]
MSNAVKIALAVLVGIIGLVVLLGAVVLVKNQIESRTPWLADDYYAKFQSDMDIEKRYAAFGSHDISHLVVKSDDAAIGNIRIWFPSELKHSTLEYPVVVVANASNMAALNYEPFFERLASWGFIVVGNDDRQAGTGLSTSKTLECVLELDGNPESVLNGKISHENIGAVGYSQGGAGAINAVTAYETSSKYKTLFTGSAAYSLLAENMGWRYDASKITVPYFMAAGTGASDDRGIEDVEAEYGGVAPLASLVENYTAITDDVFKIRARIAGAEHGDIQVRADGYMTAWMLYWLQGDGEAGKAFFGDSAEIARNANWQDVEKNH